jgi:hypothetical protein
MGTQKKIKVRKGQRKLESEGGKMGRGMKIGQTNDINGRDCMGKEGR